MKKYFILCILVIGCISGKSQTPFTVKEGEPALIYSLPKTLFSIEIETEKVNQKPGIFYRYSERYLATNKVITEEKTTYRLKSIHVKTIAVPDSAKTFSIAPGSLQTSRLSVNAQGLLCGINVPGDNDKTVAPVQTIPYKDNSRNDQLLPLGEEYMLAGSEAKLAEGVAKQIYHIRESRIGLLTADAEKLPSDGDSFKTMLEGLNKTEHDLTELFTGKVTVETQIQTINILPSKTISNQVLFRLSALKGLVAADDLSGAPYYINLQSSVIPFTAADPKMKAEKAALYYTLPATAQMTITDGMNALFSGEFLVSQFGKTIPLPEKLFHRQGMKLKIDSQTGRLLSIE